MFLEDVFHFVEAKELGKRSATRLLDAVNSASLGTDSANSSYRRARRERTVNANQPKVTDPSTSDVCIYCGNKGHGSHAPARFGRLHCPAYDKVCKNCKIKQHLDNMCRAKNKKPSQQPALYGSESALCLTLSALFAHLRHRLSILNRNGINRNPSPNHSQTF